MQTIAPTATRHQAACEFIHNNDFFAALAVLDHIVLVTVVNVVGAQGCIQVMHQRNIGWVIQRGTFWNQTQIEQDDFSVFMALFCQKDLVRFFIQGEVPRFGHALTSARIGLALLLGQGRNHLIDSQIHVGVVFCLATDDEGCAGFVDQNRVHLVHNGEVQAALNPVSHFVHHVVAQVIKTVLVVGTVSDITLVSRLLFFTRHVGQVNTHREAEEVVELAHPTRIAAGQIVVDCHHMHALAGQCIEVDRQRSS